MSIDRRSLELLDEERDVQSPVHISVHSLSTTDYFAATMTMEAELQRLDAVVTVTLTYHWQDGAPIDSESLSRFAREVALPQCGVAAATLLSSDVRGPTQRMTLPLPAVIDDMAAEYLASEVDLTPIQIDEVDLEDE